MSDTFRRELDRLPLNDPDSWQIQVVKSQYRKGNITFREMEEAIEDRLQGRSYSPLPNEHIPTSVKNNVE